MVVPVSLSIAFPAGRREIGWRWLVATAHDQSMSDGNALDALDRVHSALATVSQH
jgi:hypothetical protein